MAAWRDFIQGKGREPGQIDNLQLRSKIVQRRIQKNNPESDKELGLQEKIDYYILSVGFFLFFYDAYGCNQLIEL